MSAQSDAGSRQRAALLIDTKKAPEPELGQDPILAERYISREFMQREWDGMWTRVWNIAGLEAFFDVWYFTLFPEGGGEYFAHSMGEAVSREAKVEHQRGKLGDISLGGGLDQDAGVFVSQQLGLRSRGYQGVYLSGQERRIQYHHQVLDEYLAGTRGR